MAGDSRSSDQQEFIGVFRPTSTVVTADPRRCPSTHPLLFTITGKAQTTAGPLDFVQSHCEDYAHTTFRRGVSKMTAVDGDVLNGTYKGQIVLSPDGSYVVIDGNYANTGGTGKFTRAYGRGVSAGTIDFTTGEIILAVTGCL
jgi:hypothetical protein